MDKSKQRREILEYCMKHGSITIRDCYDKLDMNSPSKRISEMRHSPLYSVDDIMEYVLDENGKVKTKFKRYFITALEGGVS